MRAIAIHDPDFGLSTGRQAWWRGAEGRLTLGSVEYQQSFTWHSQLQFQAGVISRQQALDAGFTEKAIKWRLRSGTWQRLHTGVYATFTGKPSREGRLWAAVLHVGPGAVLSHETAAEIHRLTDKQSTRIHVSVPAERRPGQHKKIRGVVIHRSRGLVAEWQPPWHLPRTTVEDTVLDLIAAARTFDDAYGWVTAALQDAADGVHSPLERDPTKTGSPEAGLRSGRRAACAWSGW